MTEPDAVVIVGAGLAGASAAETLREQGFSGPLTLVGTEVEPPYERPPLSKDYLLGKADATAVYVHPPAVVRRSEHRPAARDDGEPHRSGTHRLSLDDGTQLPLRQAVARPLVPLPAPWSSQEPASTGSTTYAGCRTATR